MFFLLVGLLLRAARLLLCPLLPCCYSAAVRCLVNDCFEVEKIGGSWRFSAQNFVFSV
jgi:hypothetical protein